MTYALTAALFFRAVGVSSSVPSVVAFFLDDVLRPHERNKDNAFVGWMSERNVGRKGLFVSDGSEWDVTHMEPGGTSNGL